MYCQKCGVENDDNAYKCVDCGEVLVRAGAPVPQIPTYLSQSILVTLLCCMPFGIPAIVYSAQVSGKLQSGDIEGAMEMSRKAKFWGWMSFGAGLGLIIIYLVMAAVGMTNGM